MANMERRGLLGAAALGTAALGAVALSAAVPGAAAPARAAEGEIWFKQYTGHKDTVDLAIYRKRVGPPDGKPRPVVVLVHGSTISARPTYDLTMPGRDDVSLMNVVARWGFDVWTMDHEGYGQSTRTDGNSAIASGAEDLRVLTDLIRAETGEARVHMMGESSGALRVGLFASMHPDRVGRLILQAFTYTGANSPTLAKRGELAEFYRTHNRRPREKAAIEGIFSRDRPNTTDPEVIEAVAAAEMPFGNSVPAGTYMDMTLNLPIVHPDKVLAPVLMVSGQYDGIASMDDICNFFKALPNGDRQITIVPGAAHVLVSSKQRATFWAIMKDWLERT